MSDIPPDILITDARHLRRVSIVQSLYAQLFEGALIEVESTPAIATEVAQISTHIPAIDDRIKRYAPKYPLDQIAKADLAILRLAVYELIYQKTEPTKVIINEAIELAKEMGSERAYAFVNAVLGAIVESEVTPA